MHFKLALVAASAAALAASAAVSAAPVPSDAVAGLSDLNEHPMLEARVGKTRPTFTPAGGAVPTTHDPNNFKFDGKKGKDAKAAVSRFVGCFDRVLTSLPACSRESRCSCRTSLFLQADDIQPALDQHVADHYPNVASAHLTDRVSWTTLKFNWMLKRGEHEVADPFHLCCLFPLPCQ
ncbi:hypothetical protein IE81DRAFT_208451 [Ceraceosorus guamensis]|uniref:Uncharacterized protein n=1 Tax=Ceraceosorus guamensis TaxID=1522189 RepID=A0A316W5R8_9BASI|nr:hypothetical protein IE81DRAFT_208451 [Ceraceosorus guamensis]PWN45217.1 hypothetical protein IE81DRAFT_208451 [Ceraceosorus guamensis]